MKKILILFFLLMPLAQASERQALKEILEEMRYLENKVLEALAADYQGEATQGQRVFGYKELSQSVAHWEDKINVYLATPQRKPFDVNKYHDNR